jgi:sulfide:quinone oxidoreductase
MPDPFRRPDGLPPRVLVAGGGVAALEAVLALRALCGMRVDVELIAPDPDLRYPPLEVVTPFGLTPPRVDLTAALAALGARHRRETVAAVEPHARHVRTSGGATLPYEALLVAVGARTLPPPEGLLVFGGPDAAAQLDALLEEAAAGRVERILFAVPLGVAWPLPVYELALLTAHRLRLSGAATRLALATPERVPLEIFGGRASGHVRERLMEAGIAFHGGVHVTRVLRSEVEVAPTGKRIAADRAVTAPRLRGPAVPGLPHDAEGFLPVDAHCAVRGADGVYAAGDATDQPIKQGGLATQQADAAAAAIAARSGAPVTAEPFRGVLRGMLLTAGAPQYLESDRAGRVAPTGSATPLWWPPTKVAGRYLAPFLAEQLGLAAPAPEPPEMWRSGSVPCEVAAPAAAPPAA